MSSSPPSAPTPTSPSALPPKRRGKATRHDVSKPLSDVRLPHLVNLLAVGAAFLAAFYAWRIVGYKAQVGGWWNLLSGTPAPPHQRAQAQSSASHSYSDKGGQDGKGFGSGKGEGAERLEDHITSVAHILSLHPTHVASALSAALHTHVAPASVSSLASSVAPREESAAGIVFVENEGEGNAGGKEGQGEGVMDAAGVLAKAVDVVVGSEEPFVVADV